MSRGQILGRQFIIIGSWIVLIITVALAFILQGLSGGASDEALKVAKTTDAQYTLAAYLHQTVTLNGQQVPMAEALVYYALMQDRKRFEESAAKFFALHANAEWHALTLKFPDGTAWETGVRQGAFIRGASTKIPLPDGKLLELEYKELEAVRTQGWGALAR